VHTNILEAERNRPTEFGAARDRTTLTAEEQQGRAMVEQFVATGFEPEEIAGMVLDAVRTDTFYIVPAQPYIEEAVKSRLSGILERKNPSGGLLG
jgi:hypothetical protein